MKRVIRIVCIMTLLFNMTGCLYNNNVNIKKEQNESEINNMNLITNINVTIENKKYIAKIENNEAAQSFANMLPQTFNMSELNGNEKYIYMDESLPIDSYNPKHIEAGDIMLFGDNCLVLFYKSFDTSYSYTKIGHIDNLPYLGSDNISVKFEK